MVPKNLSGTSKCRMEVRSAYIISPPIAEPVPKHLGDYAEEIIMIRELSHDCYDLIWHLISGNWAASTY